MSLPTDPKARKNAPVARGPEAVLLAYYGSKLQY